MASQHFDAKHEHGRLLVWCHAYRAWFFVAERRCCGCGGDVTGRFKAGVLEAAA